MRPLVSTSGAVALSVLTLCRALASEVPRIQPGSGLATAYDTVFLSRLDREPIARWVYSPVREGAAGPSTPRRPPGRLEPVAIESAPAAPARSPRSGARLVAPDTRHLAAADSGEANGPVDSSRNRERNLYVALRFIPGLSNVDDIKRSPDTSIALVDDTIEATAALGLALGYDWRNAFELPLKTELEYRYRHHIDLETQTAQGGIFYDASTRASQTLQVNVWAPWGIVENLDVLIGAGAGVTRHFTKTGRSASMSGATETKETYTNGFSWLVGLGVDYRFAEAWSMEAVYRYVELGKIETGTFATGDSVTYGRNYSHDLALGLVYRF